MKKTSVPSIPHSWSLEDWPKDVYPGGASKGRYLTRAHRNELVAVGALVRVGRDLVVVGAPYTAWLSRHSERVKDFSIAPNERRAESQA
jgi:hypothetical protein